MDNNQAILIIEQAIDIAVQKGIYSLKDVETILNSLKLIKNEQENNTERT